MKSAGNRLAYLDWARGLGAVVMLQGHVFDSFIRRDLRESGPFVFSQFVGGMPPAVFLFLLGVTFAFLMDSQERKGARPLDRWATAAKRSGYLFAVAFLFRLQLWITAFGKSPASDLLRVDILNCMGLAVLLLSVLAVFTTAERTRYCALAGGAIALAAPVALSLDSAAVPALLHNYFVPDHAAFGFFPWGAFVAFGMSAGSILRSISPDQVPTAIQWFAWVGLAAAFSAYGLSFVPASIYPHSDFWLDNPTLIFIKLGAVLMLVAFSWVWNLNIPEGSFSGIRQVGTASLIVYWVHVELIYGSVFWKLKDSLTVPQTVLAALMTIAVMVGLAVVRNNWQSVRMHLPGFRAPGQARVAGD